MLALVVAGTRPEVIKLSPVMRAFEDSDINYIFVATGQHYSFRLFQKFIEELKFPEPDYNLDIGSGSQAYQTARAIEGLEKIISQANPDVIVAQGDTNAVLSVALASSKLNIPFVHIEAGLRSFDMTMPEEVNRVVADHLADILFVPTERSGLNLLHEGISREKIFITGNTIVDATLQNIELAEKKAEVDIPSGYFLLTLHRAENVDSERRIRNILEALEELDEEIIFPVHPRTVQRIESFNLAGNFHNIKQIKPLGYLDFLFALKNARAVFTDSGGVQEEALTLGVPCITLRTSTERPETLEAGVNFLAGVDKEGILKAADKALSGINFNLKNPLGDGQAGKKIVETLLNLKAEGRLDLKKPEKKIGEEKRRFLRVGSELKGKRIYNSNLEIQRVIQSGRELFPSENLILEQDMLIEIIERKFY